ncbi:MAG: 2-phosphosulfolactate phosphatase [Chloroflexota bacterium]
MNIYHATLETCGGATGVVVVIDVLRAFTTAPFAFDAGAIEILPVGTLEEALELKKRSPGSLIMGHDASRDGFDYGNSPSALNGVNLHGKRLIQRTGAGTQGLVLNRNAQSLLAASFVCASATVKLIKELSPEAVVFVSTTDHGEDRACADYLEALLMGQQPDSTPYLDRLNRAGQLHIDLATNTGGTTEEQLAEFRADIICAAQIDRFDFALLVEPGREQNGEPMIMKKKRC